MAKADDHLSILVADRDEKLAQSIADSVQPLGHACTIVNDPAQAVNQARSGVYEVIVAGLRIGDGGKAILRAALDARPDCQVVILADQSNVAEAVSAMSEGAMTYLQKPVNFVELSAVIDRAAERTALARDRDAMRQELVRISGFENIIGRSQPMQRVFQKILQVAGTDCTVLIQGATGTGKELVARAIHYNSSRQNHRFVPLNCAGLVQTILESELFGHEKGAFTDAHVARMGLFEYANHGTLFLDEIGDMPRSSQVKLLRVLEHGRIVRVGSNEPVDVDVRLIAATHRNLLELVKEGEFREDLFYRINVVTISLPTLAERQGDIALLIDTFVRQFAETYDKLIQGMSPPARKVLFRYDWPGNVRELRNCIEHMIVVTTDPILGEDDLPEYLVEQSAELLPGHAFAAMTGHPLADLEREHIKRTLELVEGNREKAADLLGIGERTLYRKIEKYGLR